MKMALSEFALREKGIYEEKLLFKLLGYSAIAPFGLLLRPKTNKKIKHSAAKAGILYYIVIGIIIGGVNLIL